MAGETGLSASLDQGSRRFAGQPGVSPGMEHQGNCQTCQKQTEGQPCTKGSRGRSLALHDWMIISVFFAHLQVSTQPGIALAKPLAAWLASAMDANFWNTRYAGSETVYGHEPNAFVASHAFSIPPGPVLCLAEGEGRNALHLAALGHAVTAMDQSSVGMDKAAARARERGLPLTTQVSDLDGYTIGPDAWSGIIATFVHLPRPLRARVHASVVQGLRPGGCFVLEAYTMAQLGRKTGGPQNAELLMCVEDLKRELFGLELLIARELEREVVEGPGHTGLGAVVQILARKPRAS